MSPEQLLSTKDVDRRADLWALAVVSYHALTGRTPFEGKTMAALSMAISRGHFAPVSASVARAGPELDTWFKLALCRNIKGRWSTAAELAKTFGEAAMDRADRQESALVLRSVRPEQLAAATISVDVPSAHGEDSVETPRDLAHDATIASDDRSGAVVPARDPSPAWWLAAVALLAVVVLARNWGFWREGAANATPTSSTTASIEPSGLLLVDQPPAPHSAAPQSSVPETSAATQPSSAHQPPPERAPVPLPADRTALPTASHAAPIDCREPFIVDEHGDMHPRPECLK
jgi:serine/threonine-protein kinase